MRNKISNILLLTTLILIIFALITTCFAVDVENIISGMEYDPSSDPGVSSDNSIVKGVNVVYTLIRVAGTGIALMMVMVLGIKYMLSSVEQKAEIKKQAVPIVVGSAMVFASSRIIAIVAKIALD